MNLFVYFIVVGFLAAMAWLFNKKIQTSPAVRLVINIVIVVLLIVFSLAVIGLWDEVRSVNVPKL